MSRQFAGLIGLAGMILGGLLYMDLAQYAASISEKYDAIIILGLLALLWGGFILLYKYGRTSNRIIGGLQGFLFSVVAIATFLHLLFYLIMLGKWFFSL